MMLSVMVKRRLKCILGWNGQALVTLLSNPADWNLAITVQTLVYSFIGRFRTLQFRFASQFNEKARFF